MPDKRKPKKKKKGKLPSLGDQSKKLNDLLGGSKKKRARKK